jgi:uncharacterized membrane protein YhaH (DUF805 family)
MDAWDLFFNLRGRINRAKWWLFVVAAIGVLSLVVLALREAPQGSIGLILILYLLVLAASVPIHVKRLHDRGRSGWWLLGFYGLIALTFPARHSLGLDPMLSQSVALAVLAWMVIDLGCLRGTSGPNRYGPDPLQKGEGLPASH